MNELNIVKPLHVGISVGDMDEAIEWYGKNLGFVPVDDVYVPPLKARICFLEKDGFALELFRYDEPKPLPEDRLTPNSDLRTIGTKHVAFEADDYDAVRGRFLENGVEIVHEVRMNGNDVMFIHDNSGVLIELIHFNEAAE